MRILAASFVILAGLTWWHPMPVWVQSAALVYVALLCLAYDRKVRQGRLVSEKLAELKGLVRALRGGGDQG